MDIVAEKIVKTRKPHDCWGCMKPIPISTKTQTVTSVDGGKMATVYWCEKCVEFMGTLDGYEMQDGFEYGELSKDDRYPL